MRARRGEPGACSCCGGKSARFSTLPLQATNDGSALGIGSATTNCSVTLLVNQVPLPPVISTSTFNAAELSANGTVVGNVGASDPSNFTIANYSWAAVDVPNTFAVGNATGLITVAGSIDTLALAKTVWLYSLSVCNVFICGVYPITINVGSVRALLLC